MSIVQFAYDDEIDSQIQALNNAVDGLSLVIAQQQAVMRQALEVLQHSHPNEPIWKTPHREAVTALRNSLEGKQ